MQLEGQRQAPPTPQKPRFGGQRRERFEQPLPLLVERQKGVLGPRRQLSAVQQLEPALQQIQQSQKRQRGKLNSLLRQFQRLLQEKQRPILQRLQPRHLHLGPPRHPRHSAVEGQDWEVIRGRYSAEWMPAFQQRQSSPSSSQLG